MRCVFFLFGLLSLGVATQWITIPITTQVDTPQLHIKAILWCASVSTTGEDPQSTIKINPDGMPICEGANLMRKLLYPSQEAGVLIDVYHKTVRIDAELIGGSDHSHPADIIVSIQNKKEYKLEIKHLGPMAQERTTIGPTKITSVPHTLPVLPRAPPSKETPWYVGTIFGMLCFLCVVMIAYVAHHNSKKVSTGREKPNLEKILVQLGKPSFEYTKVN